MPCQPPEFAAPVFRPDTASEPASSAAADFAAGWALQCTLSALFADDARQRALWQRALYCSEQVMPCLNPSASPYICLT